MISARVEPTPAPAPRPAFRVAQDRHAPRFDDALREGEPAAQQKDEEESVAETVAPASAEPSAPAAGLAPAGLAVLIAQVLPQQQADGARPGTRASSLPSHETRAAAAAQPGDALDADPGAPSTTSSLPGAVRSVDSRSNDARLDDASQHVRRDASHDVSHDARGSGSARAQAAEHAPRGRHSDHEDPFASQTRTVAVRQVSSAQHFPVTADPIRQIAHETARALEVTAPSATPPDAPPSPVKTVSVQLEPESLGSVTVRMRLSGNQLSVRVDVAEPATLEMIQRERDRLQKSMSTDHVSVERLDIVAAREVAPVQGGDNAQGPRPDTNAPGQQSRQNPGASNGNGARDGNRQDSLPQGRRGHGQDHELPRGGDHRGLYL